MWSVVAKFIHGGLFLLCSPRTLHSFSINLYRKVLDYGKRTKYRVSCYLRPARARRLYQLSVVPIVFRDDFVFDRVREN